MDGSLEWAVDVKLAGHGSCAQCEASVRLREADRIDESSVKDLPGFIKVMNKGNYVAVVCEREEQAINAARQLKTTWEKPATAPFPSSDDLFNYLRAATPASGSIREPVDEARCGGNPDAAFAGAAKTIEAEYQCRSRDIPRSRAPMPQPTPRTVR